MADDEFEIDWVREERTGVAEAVLCAPKSDEQVRGILRQAQEARHRLFLTRLGPERFGRLPADLRAELDYDPVSRTAMLGGSAPAGPARVALVAAGSSDLPVLREAERTLAFHGRAAHAVVDVGVAGLHRLLRRIDELRRFDVILAFAGMEGALFTVLGGLVDVPVIAVPTSVGMGVGQGGRVALQSALSSCAPGITVVNIDNGFGAACAAVKLLNLADRAHPLRGVRATAH
ncbi:nickel pincer cofactor biosynthesis protein LarB [Geminicoccus flavidas]|uniref:nickel pincer cofactor biosynthesis protein LarB n=1 Tax=Geminicoccus flavidas TaxID=2506407 RepID=UPI0013581944|nr:nickel pincer cofactor biosynthesis protein LarB [Geminicoccus flavidas]